MAARGRVGAAARWLALATARRGTRGRSRRTRCEVPSVSVQGDGVGAQAAHRAQQGDGRARPGPAGGRRGCRARRAASPAPGCAGWPRRAGARVDGGGGVAGVERDQLELVGLGPADGVGVSRRWCRARRVEPTIGTDQELDVAATPARNGAQRGSCRPSSTTTASPVAAAMPGGPPSASTGRDARASSRPRDARPRRRAAGGGRRRRGSRRWMHSWSTPSDLGHGRDDQRQAGRGLDVGQLLDQAAQAPELAARRRVGLDAGHERHDVVGMDLERRHVARMCPSRSTAMRSASRTPGRAGATPAGSRCPPRERPIRRSTTSCLGDAERRVGSSRMSSAGSRRTARAMATSWRWPPDSVATGASGSSVGRRRRASRRRPSATIVASSSDPAADSTRCRGTGWRRC